MERCPVCRGRLKGQAVCPRCGTDLSLPLAIEHEAQVWVQRAVEWMVKGDPARAQQALNNALRLKSSPLTRALLGFVSNNAGN